MPFKSFLLVTFLLPLTLFAQSDGFFRANDNDYNNRDSWTNPTGEGGLNNQQFGQPVPGPLGSGLLILTAAGAGYAVLHRKRSRKNITMLLAFALILGMTNCKKKTDTIDVTEGVRITLNVNNDSKHSINLENGLVTYTDGDRIFVGNNGKFCGILQFNGTNFTGDINPTQEGVDLVFYYVSAAFKDPNNIGYWSLKPGTTTYNLDISNQKSRLPVLSCGRSTVPYTSGTTSYSCWLENKCALVKFDCPEGVNAKVKITGLITEATLDFANETITPTSTIGEITLYSNGLNEKWAILLPQTVSTPPAISVSIAGYASDIEIPDSWVIRNNDYTTTGVTISNVPALFKAYDHIVTFSPGNLRATTSDLGATWTWSFASNQYDYIGNNTANNKINGNKTVAENGTVDLFGWSTDKSNPVNYYGINISADNADYSSNFVDWGGLAIGEYAAGTWRTMTVQEWNNLIDGRDASTVNGTPNARFTRAVINTGVTSVNGIIIFPDNSIGDTPDGVVWGDINKYDDNHAATTCTSVGWNSLESKGCIFLPAGGYRHHNTPSATSLVDVSDVYYGGYWSSSTTSDNKINYFYFQNTSYNPWSIDERHRGHSVRLVRDVE